METEKEKWEYVIEALTGTVDEIAARTGLTRISVQNHIASLKKARTVKVLAVTQRQAVLNAMPGTANQIAERTGTNVNAVWHHIYSLRDSGEVEKAGRIRTPTPAARFRTAVVYGKTGELPELPPLGPVERAKARPRPGRKKKPTKPPHTAKKAWVIDSPYRTIFAGPHPYGGSER